MAFQNTGFSPGRSQKMSSSRRAVEFLKVSSFVIMCSEFNSALTFENLIVAEGLAQQTAWDKVKSLFWWLQVSLSLAFSLSLSFTLFLTLSVSLSLSLFLSVPLLFSLYPFLSLSLALSLSLSLSLSVCMSLSLALFLSLSLPPSLSLPRFLFFSPSLSLSF